MRKLALIWAIASAGLLGGAGAAHGTTAVAGETLAIQDMQLTIPAGWRLRQDARDGQTMIFGFENGSDYLTFFVKGQTGLNMKAIFANDARVMRDVQPFNGGKYGWQTLETARTMPSSRQTLYVSSFMAEHDGHSYYGYARASSASRAREIVDSFLNAIN